MGARAIFESAEQYPRPFDKAWAPLWLRLEYAQPLRCGGLSTAPHALRLALVCPIGLCAFSCDHDDMSLSALNCLGICRLFWGDACVFGCLRARVCAG